MTFRERFQSKVDTDGPVPTHRPELGPCHVWTAAVDSWGYGNIWFEGACHKAHRVAFFLAHGRWPEPLACHHCDNPGCVRVEHLFEGTNKDNCDDRDKKGRLVNLCGERHGMHKLTDQDVRDIRANFALCRVTMKELGKRFGVSGRHIANIVRGLQRTSA